MCRLLEVDPYITVNAGTGDAWSAAQWVELPTPEDRQPREVPRYIVNRKAVA